MNDENARIGISKMRFTGINFMQSMELLFRHMSAHSKDHYTYPPRNIKMSKYSDRKKTSAVLSRRSRVRTDGLHEIPD